MIGGNSIKNIAKEDRPYELAEKNGVETLSDTQLLAIILRTGVKGCNVLELAENVLKSNSPRAGLLVFINTTIQQFMKISGIGKVKAIQLQCIGELSKRIRKTELYTGIIFTSPDSIANYCMEDMRHEQQEIFRILLLNTKHRLTKNIILTKGTVKSTLISVREIFIEAVRHEAVKFVLVHNHPSGDPMPSAEDIEATNRICEAGYLMGIELLDHIIIGDNSYISLKERGHI
jgi:DNA repair protein radc